jgi:sporulation protein YlmC with PRC-barrel domain
MSQEINVELLIGRRVYDESGKKIGHLEEILAVETGDDLVVSEYHVGAYGFFERLSAYHFGIAFLRLFGARGHLADPTRIPWNELDLSDPHRPVWRKP